MDTSELDGWIANLAPIYLQPEVIDGFVQRIDDAIAVANPEVAADRELRRDVDASTAAQLRVIVAVIAGGSQEVTPPPESVALALTVARRGMDLRVLLKIYGAGRLAMLGFVDESIEALPIGPELKRALLVRVWGSAMRWLEVTTELLVATYAKERESLARGAFARRSETVHAIVAGEALHSDEVSQILDYPMRRHHTAFVLWTDDTDPAADVLARLDSYARSFVDESNAERVLTLLRGRARCGRGSRISTTMSGRRSIVLGIRIFVSRWGPAVTEWKDSRAVTARLSPRSASRSVRRVRRGSPSTKMFRFPVCSPKIWTNCVRWWLGN